MPTPSSSLPYGIGAGHFGERPVRRMRPLLQLLIIGIPLAAAMLGFLGGGAPRIIRAASPGAQLTVEAPRVLRSGNWFETRVIVEPAADVADLAIAIDQPLWRRMSIDTLVPDAEKAESAEGRFTYSFGPVAGGERFVLKLDGQIQPYGLRILNGRIGVRDGDNPLVSAPVTLVVLP